MPKTCLSTQLGVNVCEVVMVIKWVRDNACLTSNLQITDNKWLSTQSVIAWYIHKKGDSKTYLFQFGCMIDCDDKKLQKEFSSYIDAV